MAQKVLRESVKRSKKTSHVEQTEKRSCRIKLISIISSFRLEPEYTRQISALKEDRTTLIPLLETQPSNTDTHDS